MSKTRYVNLRHQELTPTRGNMSGMHCFKCGYRFTMESWWYATAVFTYDWQENEQVVLCDSCAQEIEANP